MKYVPRKSSDNHNVSKTRAEVDLLVLSLGFIGILVALYILMGIAGALAVRFWPSSVESMLGRLVHFEQDKNYRKEQKKLTALLDQAWPMLKTNMPTVLTKPSIVVTDCPQPNAFAVPGGVIVFCHSLIQEFGSENEMAMILGHELAHLKNRDGISAVGSGLFLLLGKAILANLVDIEIDLVFQSGVLAALSYSRAKEKKSDLFGLEMIVHLYGHAGGAEDVFTTLERLEKKLGKTDSDGVAIFHSHPLSNKRREYMQTVIRERGYKVKRTKPLAF